MTGKIRLIINADDYGMSPLFNRGILELAQKNIISSLTVMIKRDFIDVTELKNMQNISLGLHLELQADDTPEEMESQIKSFTVKLGCLPSHLDSHHHLHLTKQNLPRVIKIAKKYNLPIRSYLSANRKMIKAAGIKTSDGFIGWHPERIGILEDDFQKLSVSVAELACHPGYYDKNSTSSYNLRREQELTFLKSAKFKAMVKKFKIINYHEF